MAKKIYSCAKAHFLRKDETLEQTWNWITYMFDNPNHKAKNFVPGGYSLEPSSPSYGSSKLGDIFKYVTHNGSEMFIKITEWEPFHTLKFNEDFAPTSGIYVDSLSDKAPPNIMKFTLSEHYEGTFVKIERVEVALFSFKDRVSSKFLGGFNKNSCVSRLVFILTGGFPDGKSYVDGTYTVTRDDSLKYRL
jgi:hypothetical protein